MYGHIILQLHCFEVQQALPCNPVLGAIPGSKPWGAIFIWSIEKGIEIIAQPYISQKKSRAIILTWPLVFAVSVPCEHFETSWDQACNYSIGACGTTSWSKIHNNYRHQPNDCFLATTLLYVGLQPQLPTGDKPICLGCLAPLFSIGLSLYVTLLIESCLGC